MDADRLVTASQLLSKKGEFDGEPNEPFCCQPRVGYKSWAHVLRHMKMFKENVAGYTWHRSSLGQTVEKAMKMFKKDSTRAHLLLPSSSPVLHCRCSTVVAVWKCVAATNALDATWQFIRQSIRSALSKIHARVFLAQHPA